MGKKKRASTRGAQAPPSAPASAARGGLWTPLFLLAALAVLAYHASRYLPFLADDALISLRYARRLLDGAGLTWNDGERVEGYSNLLMVLGCAGLGRLGLDLVLAARLLCALGTASVLAAAAWLFGRGRGVLPPLFACLALAVCGPVAIWAVGGMEQPLVMGLVAWALVLCLPHLDQDAAPPRGGTWLAGLLLGLACLARPDSPLFAAGAAAGLLVLRGLSRRSLRLAAPLALVPAVFVAGQIAFRLAYYGDWLPNPARVKIGFTAARLLDGLDYLASGAHILLPLLGVVAVALAAARPDARARRRLAFLAIPFVLWAAYVAVIGGDIFIAHRHHLPLAVLGILLAAEALAGAASAGRRPARYAWTAALAGLLALGVLTPYDTGRREWVVAMDEWDGRDVGLMLKRAFGDERPLVAVDSAGYLPYYSGLPCLDMLGLNDPWLSRHRPAGFGGGRLGHELGDASYTLGREHDLIVFGLAAGLMRAQYPATRAMQEDPRFQELYQYVEFQTDAGDASGPLGRIWVRREGGAVGVRREGGRVTVPGYLATGAEGLRALPDERGRLGVLATHARPATLRTLRLEPGGWNLVVNGAALPFLALVWNGAEELDLRRTASGIAFEVPAGAGPVDIQVAPPEGVQMLHVRRLDLERL